MLLKCLWSIFIKTLSPWPSPRNYCVKCHAVEPWNNTESFANMKGGRHKITRPNPDKCRECRLSVEQKKTIFIDKIGQKYSYATWHSTHWRYYWQPDDNNFWKQKEEKYYLVYKVNPSANVACTYILNILFFFYYMTQI